MRSKVFWSVTLVWIMLLGEAVFGELQFSSAPGFLWMILLFGVTAYWWKWWMSFRPLNWSSLAIVQFENVCRNSGLSIVTPITTSKGRENVVTLPSLSIRGGEGEWTAIVRPLHGQSLDDYQNNASRFSLAFGVPVVRFQQDANAILMTVSSGRVPESVNYPAHEQMSIGHWTPDALRGLLEAVPIATKSDGSGYALPVVYNHILIVGRTGAGKGSYVWTLILSLAPLIANGWVRLWGIDPKRVELGFDESWFDIYADQPDTAVEALERAVMEMNERAAALKGKARKFVPSETHPLNVIVIDELGYLVAMMADKKLRERAEKAVTTLLALGRACGFSVVGAIQDPRKETLSFRDLFPIRIALGLPAGMVDLVLGNGAYEAGARCDLIPHGDGAGTAYVLTETSSVPVCVRAPWVSDEAISTWKSVVDSHRMRLAAPSVMGCLVDSEPEVDAGEKLDGVQVMDLGEWVNVR